MKTIILFLALIAAVSAGSYKLGWERATVRSEVIARTSTENIKEALWRATQALSEYSVNLSAAEDRNRALLEEIEREALSRGSVCHVPANRLLRLDAITN